MRTYGGYEAVKVGDIPQSKLEKVFKTGKLTLSANELKGNRHLLMHPANARKIKLAQSKGKGVSGLSISGGEIEHDLNYHQHMGGNLHGGSLWSWIKNKAFPWLKKNVWPALKPVLSGLADSAVPALATAFPEIAPALPVLRSGLTKLTGVGVKGSTLGDRRIANLAKARLAKQAKKSTGGSFLIQ